MIFHEIKKTYSFALPFVGMLIAQRILQLLSVIMLGFIGTDALAAAVLINSLYFIFIVMGIGTLSSIGIFIAQNKDIHSPYKISSILRHGFYVSFLLACFSLMILWFIPDLLSFFVKTPHLVYLATQFLHALMWGFPGLLGFSILRELMAALHRQRVTMYISLGVIPFYILLYLIIIHVFHLQISMAAIGYANALTEWMMFFSLGMYILKQPDLKKYLLDIKKEKTVWPIFRRILRIGLPSAATSCLEVSMFASITMMIGYFGAIALAAHQIAMQCISLVYMFPLGISLAMGLRVAASEEKNRKSIIYAGMISGALFSIVVILTFLLIPNVLVNLFIHADETNYLAVKQLSITFLFIGTLFHFFDAQQGILIGCLRGLNDTFTPMMLTILTYLVIAVGGGYFFAFQWALGAAGLWWGLALGLAFTSLSLYLRLHFAHFYNQ